MKIKDFFADRLFVIIALIITSLMLYGTLAYFGLPLFVATIFSLLLFIIIFLSFAYEFLQKKSYYANLIANLDELDQKHLVSSILQEGDYQEEKLLEEILREATLSMNNEIQKFKVSQEEYREYVETWIHEVKLPISCIQLICENNKNQTTLSILEETKRIDNFVEQALFYARSQNVEKDYSIKKTLLSNLVSNAIKKNSRQLILNHFKIDLKELDAYVYCDEKWLEFIIGQIISNSIKYKSVSPQITFTAIKHKDFVRLIIEDNGIGISQKDLEKVTEKGFTGENGRTRSKSTGIGLYLCNKLCQKMNLSLSIGSNLNQGTAVTITFPTDSRTLLGL
ncbi:MAG: sensor histidine kinase [Anaerovoracaceae bacterium]